MIARAALAGSALLLLGGCPAAMVTPQPLPPAPLSGAEACATDPDGGGIILWLNPRSVEAGETIELRPGQSAYPSNFDPLPPGCIDAVEADRPDLVRFARREDGTVTATVAEDAPSGTEIVLSASFDGREIAPAPITVFSAAADPLVGLWTQERADCPADTAPVVDFRLAAGGKFYVTWLPMGSRRDYAGSYEYDPASGALALEVESSNYLPDDRAPLTVRREGDTLHILSGSLGSAPDGRGFCREPFTLFGS